MYRFNVLSLKRQVSQLSKFLVSLFSSKLAPSPAITWLPTEPLTAPFSAASEMSQFAALDGDSSLLNTKSETPSSQRNAATTTSSTSSQPSVRYGRFLDHAVSLERVGQEDELARRRKLLFEEMTFEEDVGWDKNPYATRMRHQDEEEAHLRKIEEFQLDFSALVDDQKQDAAETQSGSRERTQTPIIEECLGDKPLRAMDRRRLFRFGIDVKYYEGVHGVSRPQRVSQLPPCEF